MNVDTWNHGGTVGVVDDLSQVEAHRNHHLQYRHHRHMNKGAAVDDSEDSGTTSSTAPTPPPPPPPHHHHHHHHPHPPQQHNASQSSPSVGVQDHAATRTVLLISNTGGGGHETACKNILDRLRRDHGSSREAPALETHKVDFVSRDLNWWFMKRAVVRFYDKTSLSGNTRVQDMVVRMSPVAEVMWLAIVYWKMMRLLRRVRPHRIICTQPMGLVPLLEALDHYNRLTDQRLLFELWLTDMPTVYCQHYFKGIRSLSRRVRKLLKIYSPVALLSGRYPTEDTFWRKQCRVGMDQVVHLALETHFFNRERRPPMPISPLVLDQMPLVGKEVPLQILYNSDDEREVVCGVCGDLLERDTTVSESGATGYTAVVRVREADHVISLMLGSNPSTLTMLEYMELFMQNEEFRNRLLSLRSPSSPVDTRLLFFIFCGRHTENRRDTPLSVVADRIRHSMQIRSIQPLRFIPMGFQTAQQIAPITARSDVVIRQSGGLSSMELLSIALKSRQLNVEQHFFIHVPLGLKRDKRVKVTSDRLRTKAIRHYEKKYGMQRMIQLQRDRCRDWTLEVFHEYLIDKCHRPWEAGNAEYMRRVIGAVIVNPKLNTSSLFQLACL